MLRRYATVFLLIFNLIPFGVAAGAQTQQEKTDADAIARIKDEGMNRSQVMDILSYITDVPGARLTGSPNIRAAQEWAKAKLAEWGLNNAHLEAWGPFGRGWALEGFAVNMVKPQYSPLIAYPKAWSPSTDGAVRGEVVYLKAKTAEELEKYKGKLKGAIVLIEDQRAVKAHFDPEGRRMSDDDLLRLANADQPTATSRRFELTPEMKAAMELSRKKLQMATDEGAGVILEPGRGDGGTMFISAASVPSPVDTPFDRRPRVWAKDIGKVIPQAVVAAEHYNRLIRMLERGSHVELEVNIQTRFYDQDLMSYNVIAEIPGTDLKDEVVMLGAHFDSWHSGTGATDNGAGSAVCMEAVRILKSLGLKPRRTIRIGLWSGEEQGLLGSRAYVTEHFGKRIDAPGGQGRAQGGEPQTPPQFEIKPDNEKVAGYFNLDNGTGKIRGIYLQGNESVRPIFREWFASFKDMVGTKKENSVATLSISNTGGTDHLSFDAVGIPGFQFIQDPVEYDTRTHHSNMDVYDRIQEDDMKQAAIIMAAFVYNTAMRDKKLPRKAMPGQPTARAGQ
ncbi:MAG TPA: M20/M25/M40 family metallo-hydrolase [Blastocatellia bacterium]|nr:M20/M25/M40 family metallo-hydrolase [Blastocatellia bacterium]